MDVPIPNISAVKRVQASELESLILEDVGLRLQEEQRFLDVVFRTDKHNIVVVPRAMQPPKKKKSSRVIRSNRSPPSDPEESVQVRSHRRVSVFSSSNRSFQVVALYDVG